MHDITLSVLLDYLSMYFIIFFVCFVGSLIRDIFDTISNLNHINLKKIIISVVFISVILKAVLDMVDIPLTMCVLVCFFSGMWSFKLLEIAMNWKVIKTLTKNILINSKDAVCKSVAKTIEELSDDKENSDEKKQEGDTQEKENNSG